jgi:hypothetical protein
MRTTFFREQHEIPRKTLREWVARELGPHADKWEKAALEILSKRFGWG